MGMDAKRDVSERIAERLNMHTRITAMDFPASWRLEIRRSATPRSDAGACEEQALLLTSPLSLERRAVHEERSRSHVRMASQS
jgi:hypothetical protein